MKKSTIQIILKVLAALLVVMTLVSFSTVAMAAGQGIDPSTLKEDYEGVDTTTLTAKIGKVMGVIRNVAVVASVIVLMIIGVKYILGSVEEKSKYKENFMPLIIGIVVVVSATTVASFIFNAIG